MMKRTFSARHVAVGNVEEGPATVDKGRVWGQAYSDRERIERELAGLPGETYDCECGVTLQDDRPDKIARHRAGRRHAKRLDEA